MSEQIPIFEDVLLERLMKRLTFDIVTTPSGNELTIRAVLKLNPAIGSDRPAYCVFSNTARVKFGVQAQLG
jgi:hypothetical protein